MLVAFKLPDKLWGSCLFCVIFSPPYCFIYAMVILFLTVCLFVSLDSAVEENTSSKITGHMTGMWISFLKRIRLVQKHQVLIWLMLSFLFFFCLDLCSDEADNSPPLQLHTLKQFEQVRAWMITELHMTQPCSFSMTEYINVEADVLCSAILWIHICSLWYQITK